MALPIKDTRCDAPYNIKLKPEMAAKHGINNVPVPCGKCYNCKKTRVAQWAFRLEKELEVSTSSFFVTLTYDNDHVPIVGGRYPMTLVKNSEQNEKLPDSQGRLDRSLQAFFKRLRYYERENRIQFDRGNKKFVEKKPIKYYACGEYGSIRRRPHMHLIIFNVAYYDSIRKAWPFGDVDIDEDVNKNNIAYTLKYINKSERKAGTGKDDYRIPEFALMSKGLGQNWITPEIESFYNRRLDIPYVVNSDGFKISMPRYYVNKMMSEATREDRIGYIKRGVEEMEKKDTRNAVEKEAAKHGRQALMKNYPKRRN